MNTGRVRSRAAALALLLAAALLVGCQGGRSAEADSQRYTSGLAKMPGVVHSSAEFEETNVSYSSKVDVSLEMQEESNPAAFTAVLDEWRRLSAKSYSDSLTVSLRNSDCSFTADTSLPP